MNCESVLRLIYESNDRALTPDERRLMDVHLPGCERCRSELALLNALIETVETTPEEQPSEAFALNVMERLPLPVRSHGFMPGLVVQRIALAIGMAAATLFWLYFAPIAEFAGRFMPVQEVLKPLSTAIRDLQAYIQSTAGAAVSRLPEPVSSSVDWGSLLVVAATLVVGYILVRTAEAFEVGGSNLQTGKRS